MRALRRGSLQVRHQPGAHGEGLGRFYIADFRQRQARTRIHAHRGPEPGVLAPHGRTTCRSHAARGCAGRRVAERGATLLVKTQSHLQSFGVDRLRRLCRLRQPLRDQLAGVGAARIDLPQHGAARAEGLLVGGPVLRRGQPDEGWPIVPVVVRGILGEVVEEGREPVEIALRERVELVIVAVGAAHRESEESRTVGLRALTLVVHAQLLDQGAALPGADARADEAGGNQLIGILRRQQVAGELLAYEPVVGLVLVVGLDHVVAIRPDAAEIIQVQAVGIAVARHIEPIAGAVLAIARAREQAIDELFIGVARGVGDECRHFLRRWRQAGQIVAHAPDERAAIGLRRKRQALRFQAREDEPVNIILRPVGALRDRRRRSLWCYKRPVRLVACAFFDPLAQGGDLFGLERLACLRWRHALARVLRLDALDQRTAVGSAWNDRRTEFLVRRIGEFRVIEAQPRLAGAGARPMAAVAVLRQDRLDRLVEGEPRPAPETAAFRPHVGPRESCGHPTTIPGPHIKTGRPMAPCRNSGEFLAYCFAAELSAVFALWWARCFLCIIGLVESSLFAAGALAAGAGAAAGASAAATNNGAADRAARAAATIAIWDFMLSPDFLATPHSSGRRQYCRNGGRSS